MKKMLIVYYTWSNGNTERIASQLQRAVGADLERIEMVHPYEGSYDEVVAQGQREVNSGFMPDIKTLQHDPADYEVIAVGTPTWWYTMAPAVKTFLADHDFSGKKVILFQTHGGWPGHTLKNMEKACKGAAAGPSLAVQFDSSGGSKLMTAEKDIDAWIRDVKQFL
ncbi:flavodoxin [Megasphaera elsdenii]|jgi:flavodoxin|uniref:flavodoxin n=1 Tax=Megasphaera elsdenii TaxID=907 RepID=UPI0024320215|nr:flavodoxin [Megasphaera elsdenii]MCI7199389.1 NAD(P)H-dependent oxidoreductase [Megasphaera elsdenii]MDY4264553.1 flavodoxin [Megasphaera elsdenii]